MEKKVKSDAKKGNNGKKDNQEKTTPKRGRGREDEANKVAENKQRADEEAKTKPGRNKRAGEEAKHNAEEKQRADEKTIKKAE